MIAQIGNQLFDGLKKEILSKHSDVTVADVFQDIDPAGSVVTFYEADYRRKEVTTNYKDPLSIILFQIDIYTEGNGRRSRSEKLQKTVDEYMFGKWHLKLTTKRPMPSNDGVYRVVMQYQAYIREETKQLLGNY